MKVVNILAALLLGACSHLGIQSDTQKIEAGCATASAAIKVLTIANASGKLTYEQQSAVLTAVGTVEPICSSAAIPTVDDVQMQAFNVAILALQAEAAKQ